MSYELLSWLTNALRNDNAIAAMLGQDSAGTPCVFSYHHRDADEYPPFPHITVARFGDIPKDGPFVESEYAGATDKPRFAVCVWSQKSVDECYTIYRKVDPYLRPGLPGGVPTNPVVANQFFSTYGKIKRTALRDDLFDDTTKSFHLHAEYQTWLQLTGTAQP